MRRYLVVADQTLGGQELLEEVRHRVSEGPARLHVVVPATDAEAGSSPGPAAAASGTPSSLPAAAVAPSQGRPRGVEEVRARAFDRLKTATARFEELGDAEVDGNVGDPDPVEAVGDALETEGPFDEILISTVPQGLSSLLGRDVVSRIRDRFDLPVTHVEAEPSGSAP